MGAGGGRRFRAGAPVVLVLLMIAAAALPRRALAVTDAADVSAINGLYVALGSPTLPGCVFNAANLGGQLGSLGKFTSITEINLSNNNIGGTIPDDLPVTLRNFFLSDNQLTGSIPVSLSKLQSLTAMSLNGNHLDGKLPDAFDSLTGLGYFFQQLQWSITTFNGKLDITNYIDLPLKDLYVHILLSVVN
nr:unnamed protein product [Digitaria exilis]